MSELIRIAIIGAGIFANVHLGSFFDLPSAYSVVAVYSRSEKSAVELGSKAGPTVKVYYGDQLSQLLSSDTIDAVDIVLPIPVQPDIIRKAFRNGKHVVSEKPIATCEEEAISLINAYNEARSVFPYLQWMVAENWRYEPSFVKTSELLKEGSVGVPVAFTWPMMVNMSPTNPYFQTQWRQGSVRGGFFLDTSVHNIAALRLVFGDVVSVLGVGAHHSGHLPPHDTYATVMQFPNNVVGSFILSMAAAGPQALTIVTTTGVVVAQRGSLKFTPSGGEEMVYSLQSDEGMKGRVSVTNELSDFASSVNNGTTHRNTADEALADLRVVLKVLDQAGP